MCPANTRGNKSRWIVFLLVLLAGSSLFAQKSREQLEREKRANLQKIAQAEKILAETKKQKRATVGQLQALQNRIRARTALIRSMKSEIKFLEEEISDISIVVNALQVDLKNLKEEYASMIYSAYKSNQGYNMLTFLFSSETFNELFMRLKYLDQYSEARKTQAEQIEKVTTELRKQKSRVQTRRDEQESLLALQLAENRKLEKSKAHQKDLITQLATKEGQLRAEVTKRKNAIERLDRMIADVVRREARSSAKVADVADNASFEEMRARLEWPVSSGFIASGFGKQPHPVLDNIYIQNSGVSIQTKQNETARAVSTGVVTRVAVIPGMQKVVMVRHGRYLTVYARLKDVIVSKGDKLKRNDPIGVVFTDADGLTQLEFQVWRGNKKLDPEEWLAKK